MNAYGIEDEDELDPALGMDSTEMEGGTPNVPRNPDADPRQKIKDYLDRQGMMRADPEMRKMDRASLDELRGSDRDIAFQNLLQKSAAQMGTIGGKAAPTGAFDEFSKNLMAQNAGARGDIMGQRKDAAAEDDRQIKIRQYMADKMMDDKQKAAALAERQEGRKDTAQYRKDMLGLREKEIGAKEKLAGATAGGKDIDRVLKLQKDYGDEESIKRLNNYRDIVANAENLVKNPSAVNDTSLLYQYVRANDPSTGVKDMELAMVQRAGPVWDRIKAFAEGMESGMMLPEKRQQLMDNLRAQAEAAEDRALETESSYEGLSKTAGVSADDVIGKRRSKSKKRAAPTGPKAGDVEDGHRFKGGDPSDPNNWEAQ